VLLVCDHRGRGLAAAVAGLAREGYALEVSTRLRRSLERLAGDPPALVLLDPMIQDGSVELQAIDRARRRETLVPLLVVAGPGEERLRARAESSIEGEAWDVVARDAPLDELRLRIERMRRTAEQLNEMARYKHRAFHDDRTELLRPEAFQRRLAEHFSAAQRHGLDLALVLIDLDRFGLVNKDHDHTVGDTLISAVGGVIRRALRAEDVAGRLGGDEFAVILPYTRKNDAALAVSRLQREIAKLSGQVPGARSEIQVSASLGYETFDGHDIDSLDTLRAHAERALREAKQQGGDRGLYYRRLPRGE
jgi:diguanylate cyclase (GGDEF)-like protein